MKSWATLTVETNTDRSSLVVTLYIFYPWQDDSASAAIIWLDVAFVWLTSHVITVWLSVVLWLSKLDWFGSEVWLSSEPARPRDVGEHRYYIWGLWDTYRQHTRQKKQGQNGLELQKNVWNVFVNSHALILGMMMIVWILEIKSGTLL